MTTALLFLMIRYYQNKKSILICFLLKGVTKILINITYLKAVFIYEKSRKNSIRNNNPIRNSSNIIVSFKQTLRVIILLFHDIAGLGMNLEEWKQL